MSNVIAFHRPTNAQRADGVMAAVNIKARRLGCDNEAAARAALSAKRAYLAGRGSAAGIVSTYSSALRATTDRVLA